MLICISRLYQKYTSYILYFVISERRKRQRMEDAISRRREFQERFPSGNTSRYRSSARQSIDAGVYTVNEVDP